MASDVLLPEHYAKLTQGSGIADDVIAERGYRSVMGAEGYAELKRLGFSKPQATNFPGLLMPVQTPDGQQPFMVYRPDTPRIDQRRNRVIKYETPQGFGVRLDCPPRSRPMLGDPRIPLWLTEGIKKGDALASQGVCVLVVLGVWNFKGKNDFGGVTLLADFDSVAWNGREVRLIFDSARSLSEN